MGLGFRPLPPQQPPHGGERDRERASSKMSGSAFNAFKSRVAVAWSPKLYITLVRGLPGTRRLHRRTLEAMRLRCCHRTV
ncbi:hypothetical protein E2562_027526 [Oryza meyeriana var. granulata]|uniref:Large ribosomal subunit protein uL30-like ferredoxin-like fold domain-containing protein n=1 Tax=Oryza meyeriana var. granulata TaxID=110450 RepID=A0A6G1CJE5_9ORYZ|nr:hypothetical protein E2562_027526 [Oryza meyeriana var. granulata]